MPLIIPWMWNVRLPKEERRRVVEDEFQEVRLSLRRFQPTIEQVIRYEEFYVKEVREALEGPLSEQMKHEADIKWQHIRDRTHAKPLDPSKIPEFSGDTPTTDPDPSKDHLEFKDEKGKGGIYATYVSVDSTRRGYRSSCSQVRKTSHGTLWTVEEKEVFFYALSHYSIHRIDKIQELLPKKSLVEIMTYYDLLYNELEAMKRSKKYFMRVVPYDKMPEAIEVNKCAISIEERLSSSLKTQPNFESVKSDSEEMLIDSKRLNEASQFYKKLPHIMNNQVNAIPRVWDTAYLHLDSIVKDVVDKLVTRIVENKVHDNITTNEMFKSAEAGKYSIKIRKRDVWNAVADLKLNRPFLLSQVYKQMPMRLGLQVVDETQSMTGKLDDMGRDKGQICSLDTVKASGNPMSKILATSLTKFGYKFTNRADKEIYTNWLMSQWGCTEKYEQHRAQYDLSLEHYWNMAEARYRRFVKARYRTLLRKRERLLAGTDMETKRLREILEEQSKESELESLPTFEEFREDEPNSKLDAMVNKDMLDLYNYSYPLYTSTEAQ
ncbi:RNA polymerase I-specific transcription initiation factor RRN5 [Cyberlindnera fabianii]|uniref:RNA polymerase I-specific transcription initiation factor RRN5 n=1 Tax=Cyberlindnera fabianii TaxID=36022 RepID=A0A1V2L9U5_CYBFA|nr:RNA polymerase I-specific transcription initiation factor RRN5 [Cyberlindnera fabianii]